MVCPICEKNTVKLGRKQCGSCAVIAWRKNTKQKLVQIFGGKCSICGYSTYVGSLDFHHVDATTKEFSLSQAGTTRSWDKVVAEAKKCVLLCSNCHREVHGKIKTISGASMVQDFPVKETFTRSNRVPRACVVCEEETYNKKYCGDVCKRLGVANKYHPPKILIEYLLSHTSVEHAGRLLLVSGKSVKDWAKDFGIWKPRRA